MQKKIDPWKWAFAILLGLVIGFLAFIWIKISTPTVTQETPTEQSVSSKDNNYADLNGVIIIFT